jgi:manganese transport protein
MISLLIFTRRPDIMGEFVNGRLTQVAAMFGAAVVLLLNIILVVQSCGIAIPWLTAGG